MQQSFVQCLSPYVQRAYGKGVPTNYRVLQLLARLLMDTIVSELRSDKYVLLDWPAYPNIGDHAIYAGTAFLLNKVLKAQCVYASSLHDFDVAAMKAAGADIPVLLQGGGNLGDQWTVHQEFREQILQQFPERRFILLPQTMYFEKQDNLERVGTLIRAQTNITIFLRDWTSYHLGVKHFGVERVRLAPDMAVSLVALMPRLITALKIKPEFEILHLRRTDKESSEEANVEIEGAHVSDWPQHDTLGILKTLTLDAKQLADQCGWPEVVDEYFPKVSWHHFLAGLQLILSGRRLVTDRLHGHIFAALCGKPHTFLANSYYKNRAFYDTWTAGLDGVQFGLSEVPLERPSR